MSMPQLTAIQLIGVLFAYSFMCVVLPALVLYPKVKNYSFMSRILIYVTSGNFFMMFIVFLFEMLHISNPVTLTIVTILVALGGVCWSRKINPISFFEEKVDDIQRYEIGIYGKKYLRHTIQRRLYRILLSVKDWVKQIIARHIVEWVIILALFALLIIQYWSNSLANFGYNASDIVVHNYWINELSNNNLYAAGIYPMGFHAVIYYLHAVFHIKTLTLLRLFGPIQLMYVVAVMYCVLRRLCKTKFAPIIGCVAYFGLNIWREECVSRFLSSLPQEFGFIFMILAVYYFIRFFECKRQETNNKREKMPGNIFKKIAGRIRSWKESDYCLVLFAITVSMTLSAHFYVTIITALICVGIVIANIGQVFRGDSLFAIVKAVISAFVIAVLPMVIAFAMGKPLQGSLGWAMNVINGENSSDSTAQEMEQQKINKMTVEEYYKYSYGDDYLPYYQNYLMEFEGYSQADIKELERENVQIEANKNKGGIAGKTAQVYDGVKKKWTALTKEVSDSLEIYVLSEETMDKLGDGNGSKIIFGILNIGLILSFLVRLRDPMKGRNLLAITLSTYLVMSVFGFSSIGLPQLMDANRIRVFLVCLFGINLGMIVDAVIYFILGFKNKFFRVNMQLVSLAALVLFGMGVQALGLWRDRLSVESLETNGAISCLYSIIDSQKNDTWTIISCNDEMRMSEGVWISHRGYNSLAKYGRSGFY